MTLTKQEEYAKIDSMLNEAVKRVEEYVSEGRGEDFATAEDFKEILHATRQKFEGNEPDNAASSYIVGTNDKRIWYDVWTQRIGVDFDVLRWRLLYYDGRNHSHYDDCHWEWPEGQYK